MRGKQREESSMRDMRDMMERDGVNTYSPLQEIHSTHARHLPGDYQKRFRTLSTVVSCSILLAIPETCQANNLFVRFGDGKRSFHVVCGDSCGDMPGDASKRFKRVLDACAVQAWTCQAIRCRSGAVVPVVQAGDSSGRFMYARCCCSGAVVLPIRCCRARRCKQAFYTYVSCWCAGHVNE